ncbi:MAG: hypothetical protein ACRDUW_20560 [Pseudonocardiaceae bacterium]
MTTKMTIRQVLTDMEAEIHKQGWDKIPLTITCLHANLALSTFSINSIDTLINNCDDIPILAHSLEPSPQIAHVIICEAWEVVEEHELPEISASDNPDRYQVRFAVGISPNGTIKYLERKKGEEPSFIDPPSDDLAVQIIRIVHMSYVRHVHPKKPPITSEDIITSLNNLASEIKKAYRT